MFDIALIPSISERRGERYQIKLSVKFRIMSFDCPSGITHPYFTDLTAVTIQPRNNKHLFKPSAMFMAIKQVAT